MSNIGSISYINQNQNYASELHSKALSKTNIELEQSPVMPEIKSIEESSKSASTNTNFNDDESSFDENKKENKKKAYLFGMQIQSDEEEENNEDEQNDTDNEHIFDKKV
ncbi:hypothetical protein [Campylobacter canadensis]|uniref:Uncharacterized protein n=1 Tax=Campylobacter canadensis TaxID=449520 RepID=A0ABS7WP38_9BACT|nr:hypothetical protein [Campylobacter canadensis]MBZ7986528.1 hypothetical protein [Campylobacter canadensis]MBZ7994067.1 hypothetical protein [Campylobacter canadensis]MBZ7995930.1 hypothetical protein [Campylobacter canadensis]MBZ7997564.1 hypothetical protein [Campylobacter canadensis]MBZ7999398.1 hypothetical protein [Campylobacter canadensis]